MLTMVIQVNTNKRYSNTFVFLGCYLYFQKSWNEVCDVSASGNVFFSFLSFLFSFHFFILSSLLFWPPFQIMPSYLNVIRTCDSNFREVFHEYHSQHNNNNSDSNSGSKNSNNSTVATTMQKTLAASRKQTNRQKQNKTKQATTNRKQ